MYQRRRARALLGVLVLIALALVTVDFRAGMDGPLAAARRVATAALEPVQDALGSVMEPVGDAVGDVRELFGLRAENSRLRTRMAELENRREAVADLSRENDELRGLLGMRERLGYGTIAAEVVAIAPSNFEWTITLDVGTSEGVAVDMPVVNSDGLVGRVIQATSRAARVLLLIDPNFTAAVRDATLGETGPLQGQGGDLLLYEPFDPDAAVSVGSEIVTSSYDNGVFPPGIPVGVVEEIGEVDTLLTRDVLVRPYADFTRLDQVLVVDQEATAPLPPSDPVAEPFDPPRLMPGPGGDDAAEQGP